MNNLIQFRAEPQTIQPQWGPAENYVRENRRTGNFYYYRTEVLVGVTKENAKTQCINRKLSHNKRAAQKIAEHWTAQYGIWFDTNGERAANPFYVATDNSPTIAQLAERWEDFKQSNSTLSPKTRVEIRSYARWIRNVLGHLKPKDLHHHRHQTEVHLRQMNVTDNTRRKYVLFLNMFATWLRHEHFISENPFEGIRFKPGSFSAEFYSIDELQAMFRFIHKHCPDLIGYYSLLAFAGLRPSEAARVTWPDINFQTVELYVRKGKTNARHIELQPVAIEWLTWHRQNTPPDKSFVELRNLVNREKWIHNHALDREWIPDGLRHGFATFYRAKIKDVGQVADYMGNSPGIVKCHYARTVPKTDCLRFWSLTPRELGITPERLWTKADESSFLSRHSEVYSPPAGETLF
jgi:integrase